MLCFNKFNTRCSILPKKVSKAFRNCACQKILNVTDIIARDLLELASSVQNPKPCALVLVLRMQPLRLVRNGNYKRELFNKGQWVIEQ